MLAHVADYLTESAAYTPWIEQKYSSDQLADWAGHTIHLEPFSNKVLPQDVDSLE